MKTVWAPWRIAYLTQAVKDSKKRSTKTSCIFCQSAKSDPSVDSLVLHQGRKAFVIMNKYPYANGHLMVIPRRHLADLAKIDKDEHAEMGFLLGRCSDILKKYSNSQGFNIGMNLGEAAGAGIRDHLHYHIVPRWNGDHNFMPVFGDTRVIPEHLFETYAKLRVMFAKL